VERGAAGCESVCNGSVPTVELNSILQHPKVTAELMVKGGVKPGIALQFVSNIKKFQQEAKKD
jgi:hypothetical protein